MKFFSLFISLCSIVSFVESIDYFTCDNGARTIYSSWQDDGWCDCNDCSDESNWTCDTCVNYDDADFTCDDMLQDSGIYRSMECTFECDDGCTIPGDYWADTAYCDCSRCEDEDEYDCDDCSDVGKSCRDIDCEEGVYIRCKAASKLAILAREGTSTGSDTSKDTSSGSLSSSSSSSSSGSDSNDTLLVVCIVIIVLLVAGIVAFMVRSNINRMKNGGKKNKVSVDNVDDGKLLDNDYVQMPEQPTQQTAN